jgi:hypothetical protein
MRLLLVLRSILTTAFEKVAHYKSVREVSFSLSKASRHIRYVTSTCPTATLTNITSHYRCGFSTRISLAIPRRRSHAWLRVQVSSHLP